MFLFIPVQSGPPGFRLLLRPMLVQMQAQQLEHRHTERPLFRPVTFAFVTGQCVAVRGLNGTGKSTLLQTLYGHQMPTQGTITLSVDGNPVDDDWPLISAFSAPYLWLPDDMEVFDFFAYHFTGRHCPIGVGELLNLSGLTNQRRKRIGVLSSGQAQRVRLCVALFDSSPLLFFDEPCTNLDEPGIAFFLTTLAPLIPHKLIFIASNDVREMSLCNAEVVIEAV